MGRLAAAAVTVVLAAASAGCAPAVAGPWAPVPWPPAEGEPARPVWVVRHGWHTRVAVRRADVDPALWPESRAFGDVAYLEVGWGDRDFYPKPDPSLWDAIDAVIRPTPAALHVGGFDAPPEAFVAGTEVVRIAVTERGFDQLTRYIHQHYARDAAGQPILIRPGHYPRSWFYEATARYHVLRNSNYWAARALAVAGVPTSPAAALTAATVMAQARRHGTPVGAPDAGPRAGR